MFIRLSASKGRSSGAMGTAIGALDEVFNPAAARARESLKHDNERVMATPSPGDRLLAEGRIVIPRPPDAAVD